MKAFLVLTALTFVSGPALASVEANAGKNPYQQLKELYENATHQPITFQDFDPLVGCALSKHERPEQVFETGRLAVVELSKQVKGERAKGPLFPGTPDRILTKQVIYWRDRADWKVESLSFDFVSTQNENDEITTVLTDRQNPSELSVKKTGEFLAFRYWTVFETGPSNELYGYCWK